MAINIFSGSNSSGPKSSVNSAARSVRAQQAKAALASPSEVSDSGSVAVSSQGTLGKIGNAIGSIANIGSKFLPGVWGGLARVVANKFNDPEWWQQVPGDALTLNEPLRSLHIRLIRDDDENWGSLYALRSAMLEVVSAKPEEYQGGAARIAIDTTEDMITQYLMPEIRKVVNAVPLQNAEKYKVALEANATIYAIWRQLRKFDYLLKHGQTYIPNLNDPAFPLFRTENAAWLQSTINRLEEYLRANVRLPHTLCEYLAWRYGRIYKSNSSAKSALVMYNVVGLDQSPITYDNLIRGLMTMITSDPEVQKANSDLYNTYFDHDYLVEIKDDTQMRFDFKEFMLRNNCTVQYSGEGNPSNFAYPFITIDSALDNPTTFMASTVSAIGRSGSTVSQLFPVEQMRVWFAHEARRIEVDGTIETPTRLYLKYAANFAVTDFANEPNNSWFAEYVNQSQLWMRTQNIRDLHDVGGMMAFKALHNMIACKAVDVYNISTPIVGGWMCSKGVAATDAFEVSSLSMDAGAPTEQTIYTEQIYAFANLVDIGRKHSMSYRQAEKLVAKETANMIEKVDVAAVKS